MAPRQCRWGILGTAVIAQKNWLAIRNSGNGTVVAVASRHLQRAQEFIADRQAERPITPPPEACSYEELLGRKDVDAVYIPLPTGLRKEWVIRAARAGKHVMCEKPCAVSAGDLEEMVAACQENNVQFMDGVMYMHSQRMAAMRAALDDPSNVGEIRRITTQFSFRAPDEFLSSNIRMSSALEPQGCLGDLGWYTIRLILWTMKYTMPRRVIGRMLSEQSRPDSPATVPMEFTGDLLFDNGVSAGFYCSFLTDHQQWAHVSGSKGFLQISDFVLPNYGNEVAFQVVNNVFHVSGCDFHMQHFPRRVAVAEYSDSVPNSQEANLFRTFGELVLGGRPDPHWAEVSLKTQRVMDACLQSARQGGEAVELS